jgi:hypothetical protein
MLHGPFFGHSTAIFVPVASAPLFDAQQSGPLSHLMVHCLGRLSSAFFDDFAHWPLSRGPTRRAGLRQVRGSTTRHSASVRSVWYLVRTAMLPASGRFPHGESKDGSGNPLDHRGRRDSTIFKKPRLTRVQGTELGHRRLAPRDRSRPVPLDAPLRPHRPGGPARDYFGLSEMRRRSRAPLRR